MSLVRGAGVLVGAGLWVGCAVGVVGASGPSGAGGGAAAAEGPAGGGGSGATTGAGGQAGDAPGTGGAPRSSAGGAGTSGAPAVGGTVTFHPPSQTFQGALGVTLRGPDRPADPGQEIRYTTDGQPPSAGSPVYSGAALQLTATTQVRAQLFAGGTPVGPATAGLYVARTIDARIDLPIVVVDTYGRGPLTGADRAFVDAAFMTFGLANGTASLAVPPQLASRAGIHVRGKSSSSFPKMPYRIELRDGGDDDDLDQPVLGMPAESDWALHGPYPDKTLIRNAFVYGLGREMGLPAPRFVFVELYLNTEARPLGAEDYLGVYLLVETIKNQKDRLDLRQLGPQDLALPALSGGYIFKFETLAAKAPILTCVGPAATCWSDLELVDPDPAAPDQAGYIRDAIQAFHDALRGASFADPAAGYAPHIDLASFVDQLLIQELTRNVDAYVRSQYFHKDRDGKIAAGPLWDYDLTSDVGGLFQNRDVEGWQHEASAGRGCNDWFQRLWSDPAFVSRVGARWRALRAGLLSDAAVEARIASLTAGLTNAAARNFARWTILPSPRAGPFETPTQPTWQGQVDHMRSWLRSRSAWIDTQLP